MAVLFYQSLLSTLNVESRLWYRTKLAMIDVECLAHLLQCAESRDHTGLRGEEKALRSTRAASSRLK